MENVVVLEAINEEFANLDVAKDCIDSVGSSLNGATCKVEVLVPTV
jgi:hypothetical protein